MENNKELESQFLQLSNISVDELMEMPLRERLSMMIYLLDKVSKIYLLKHFFTEEAHCIGKMRANIELSYKEAKSRRIL